MGSDYTMESGGKRTYEAWKDADMMESELKKEKEKEAAQDQMKALEQKSIDVQAEMQRLEDLDAIRSMNKRLGARDQTIEEALEFLAKRQEEQDKEQELLPQKDLAELAGFRQAQEERRRKLLDDEVEGLTGDTAAASSSSAPSSAISSDAPKSGTSALIASAVAERTSQAANRSTVGAHFSVKRKRLRAKEVMMAPRYREHR